MFLNRILFWLLISPEKQNGFRGFLANKRIGGKSQKGDVTKTLFTSYLVSLLWDP